MTTDSLGNEIGKLFIGGLHQITTSESLKSHFKQYGDIEDAVVMMDHRTGRSRGFGYVKFTTNEGVEAVLVQKQHIIDGKDVDPKQCNVNMKGKNRRSLKVFVGGIAPEQNEETVRSYFSQFGNVTDVNLMADQSKQRHRGFAFVGFDDEQVVKNLVNMHYVNLNGKQVEVKAMEPPNPKLGGSRPMAGPGGSPGSRGRGRLGPMGQIQGGMNGNWPNQAGWPQQQGAWGQNQSWNPWGGQGAAASGATGWDQNGWGAWGVQRPGATGTTHWDQSGATNPAWAAAMGPQGNWGQPTSSSQWNWDPAAAAQQNGAASATTNQWGSTQQQPAAGFPFPQPTAGTTGTTDWRTGVSQHTYHPYKR